MCQGSNHDIFLFEVDKASLAFAAQNSNKLTIIELDEHLICRVFLLTLLS